jgi:hypothetical protein
LGWAHTHAYRVVLGRTHTHAYRVLFTVDVTATDWTVLLSN